MADEPLEIRILGVDPGVEIARALLVAEWVGRNV